jgi:hypothetical protein
MVDFLYFRGNIAGEFLLVFDQFINEMGTKRDGSDLLT